MFSVILLTFHEEHNSFNVQSNTSNSVQKNKTVLCLMRHAQALSPVNGLDSERPLTHLGKEQQSLMAKLLKEKEPSIEKIYTSPLIRAKESGLILKEEFPQASLLIEPLLGSAFDSEALLHFFQKETAKQVLFLGHEPTLALFILKLLEKPISFKLRTSSVVIIEFEGSPDWGKGQFRSLYSLEDL